MEAQLLHMAWTQTWQLTVLVAIVWAVTRLFARNRPHLALALWLVVLLKGVTPPLFTSPSGIFCWLQPAENASRGKSESDGTAAAPAEVAARTREPDLGRPRSHRAVPEFRRSAARRNHLAGRKRPDRAIPARTAARFSGRPSCHSRCSGPRSRAAQRTSIATLPPMGVARHRRNLVLCNRLPLHGVLDSP